jgi:hypothetical protein
MRRLFVSPSLRQQNLRDVAEHDRIMRDIQRDRLRTTARPITPARPAPPPRAPAVARRPIGYPDGRPHLVCAVCGQPAHVDAKHRCEWCAAELAWRVGLLQAGLRFVVG